MEIVTLAEGLIRGPRNYVSEIRSQQSAIEEIDVTHSYVSAKGRCNRGD